MDLFSKYTAILPFHNTYRDISIPSFIALQLLLLYSLLMERGNNRT
jgi:hypothetical protein